MQVQINFTNSVVIKKNTGDVSTGKIV